MLLHPAVLGFNPWGKLSINYISQNNYEFARMHGKVRTGLLPFSDTMLDILLLPLQMCSVLCVPEVCTVLTVSVTSLPSGRISELKKRVQSGYAFPTSLELSCYRSPLVVCVPSLKATTPGLPISDSLHAVTFSCFQKLLCSWLLLSKGCSYFVIVSSSGE